MGFWITYAEVKALYPFITDEALAYAIETNSITARHFFKDSMAINSNDMKQLRYEKKSLVKSFTPLFEDLRDECKTGIERATELNNNEALAYLKEYLKKIEQNINILKSSILDNPAIISPSKDEAVDLLSTLKRQLADRERELVQATQARDHAILERDALAAKVTELETEQDNSAGQKNTARTAPGLQAAEKSRVQGWKGYAVVMVKVAYDCGLEDRKQVTRAKYQQLADRHGKLSSEALELLRGALPEGVTKKTGGPASQG
ncbi:hypothetical protein GTA51_17865 [Desulfovibrio aerotolerans]|uniref:Uncharacterized protein n=1 Tax=Solidesulfovibrio aerotolerans TaxID=295255 RepID=A0A7C9IVL3_9BACT|nr:hypothetical protein [Solidesulfovibrio aerotolerans]MYL84980.1 hypothetical protein [Solidesulfovibrio aerotolerans]